MKDNLTEIVCILDRSGSMQNIATDTIGGFNTFIEQQKSVPGDCFITLALFDDLYEVPYNHIPIADLPLLDGATYVPRGWTALLDAIGKTINEVGIRLASTPEEEKPSKVIVTIITDGAENRSTEFTKDMIKKMIETQTNEFAWEFMFLGANIDSIGEAESLGIMRSKSANFGANSQDTQKMFRAMSLSYTSSRGGNDQYDLSAVYKDA